MVGPLVFCSVVLGFAALGEIGASGGKIMRAAFGLYVLTTCVALAQASTTQPVTHSPSPHIPSPYVPSFW